MKTLIRNGRVLLRDRQGWRLENLDLLIREDRIEKMGSALQDGADKVIDAADHLIMPGLINAHTHVYMTLQRNLADDLAFFGWLDRMLAVEDGMTQEDIYWATMLGFIEMIRSGTTCFVDMTIKSAEEKAGPRSAVAGAAVEAGMRAVISRGLAGEANSEESLMKYGQAVREMEMFRGEPLVQFIHGPHAPYSCKADYLRKLTESARERGIGQTIHLSESLDEVEKSLQKHGKTPIMYVDGEGVLDVPVIAAHCVYATDEEIALMARKRVSIALCPKSNMKLGNGFAPVRKFQKAGINLCLGTDGCGSNNALNMFAEMNMAGMVFKGVYRDSQCMGAGEVLDLATLGGAKAIGREGELGVIREGALADLILLDLKEPEFLPANNVISGLVYSATGREVDTVMVNGKVLMENRKLTTIDEDRVYAECRKITERLKMGEVTSV